MRCIFINKFGNEVIVTNATDTGVTIMVMSPFTYKFNSLEIPVTADQLNDYYHGNLNVQNAFPTLSPAEREFIMTGTPDEEFPKGI